MIKKTIISIYILLIVALATATFVENIEGTPFTDQYFYGSWWFILLWALLIITGLFYIFRHLSPARHLSTLILHLSMVIILIGAMLTHTLAFKGMMYLRGDQPTNRVEEQKDDGTPESMYLPFSVRLDHFNITYHKGTTAPSNFITKFKIIDGAKTIPAKVSMNHIFMYKGVRFYQASYDTDNMGSYLSVSRDPYGITVTYIGYALLFFSLFWLLLDPKGTFRQLLHKVSVRNGLLTLALLMGPFCIQSPRAATVIPQETAKKFGRLFINYDNRICSLQTFALDFTNKLHNSRSYKGMTAEQVVMSWIFYSSEWDQEPFIRIKNTDIRHRFDLPEYANVNDFFRNGDYILGPTIQEYAQGQADGFHKACADLDGKLQLIMELQHGNILTIFPSEEQGQIVWYSPVSKLDRAVSKKDRYFIRELLPLLSLQLKQKQIRNVNHILDKTLKYQERHGSASIPSQNKVQAELVYNRIPLTTILAMTDLTIGLLLFVLIVTYTIKQEQAVKVQITVSMKLQHFIAPAATVLLTLSELALTLVLALRWMISGTIPLSNGYDTMLVLSWFSILITLIAALSNRRMATLFSAFGFLLSGFSLLVSHIGQMDPAIGPVMPVLNSPLLSIHVSLMMMSYALLGLTFICSLTTLILFLLHPSSIHDLTPESPPVTLMDLSRIFLYPAIVTLGTGTFIGAIWANISWGSYWSWDPKETWALITFMVYAIPLHSKGLTILHKPLFYHAYMILAFLVLLMTYFGVNLFLGGMHSYA
ncbi:MAG: cytochrome c biogenesis protein CcsA [Prevotella sp.]|jgi:cytochrome c-type biogenesis protein CcsB|nr:cytochrome c biogenesis protein CcsA [Prevotella sp.]MCI1290839.1 cytochrome c biogenesis protein CcsA [Prevotella sp.]MCI1548288.1 cytochrome c biogenesis protein CcsA [Prevotella sp.]